MRDLPKTERLSHVRRDDGERGIWQRRLWKHAIRDDADYAAHVDYVHFNPVKHGLVAAPAEWPYSTFKACVDRGLYPRDGSATAIRSYPLVNPACEIIRRNTLALFRPSVTGLG